MTRLPASSDRVHDMEKDSAPRADVFLNDDSVKHRLVGVGVLTRDQAEDLGCVGPMLRASGVSRDTRTLGYAAYGAVDFAPGRGDRRGLLRALRRAHPRAFPVGGHHQTGRGEDAARRGGREGVAGIRTASTTRAASSRAAR